MVKRKGKVGRLPKITPEIQASIVESITMLLPYYNAAERAGISNRTLTRWLTYGRRQPKGGYRLFWLAVKKAEAEATLKRASRISLAGEGGQVIERTTKTITKETLVNGKPVTTTTTTSTERYTSPQWQADAWTLERRNEGYVATRKKDIAEAVRDEVSKALKNAALRFHSQTGPEGNRQDHEPGDVDAEGSV